MRHKHSAYWVLLLAAGVLLSTPGIGVAAPAPMPAPAACDAPITIMPLGDSITKGTGSGAEPYNSAYQVGYRQSLFLQLQAAGFDIKFVGSQSAGQSTPPAFDYAHEGWGGKTPQYIADSVDAWLTANPAQVVLLHIGTNDPSQVSDVGRILDTIRAHNPAIVVVLARIINLKSYSRYGKLTSDFNQAIATLASQKIAQGYKIVVVNQEGVLAYPRDMYDSVHPTSAGYLKMANAWLNTLKQVLPTVCTSLSSAGRVPTAVPDTGMAARAQALAQFDRQVSAQADRRRQALAQFDRQFAAALRRPARATDTQPAAAGFCPESMIAYWPLDETALVSSGYNLDDLCNGAAGNDAVVTYFPTLPGAGRVGGGQNFYSTGSSRTPTELDVPGNAAFNWGQTDSFSIEFWMRGVSGTTCQSGNQAMIGRYLGNYTAGSPDARWWIGCAAASGAATFQLGDNAGNTLTLSGTAIAEGDWHHIVGVRDGAAGTNSLYVDGTRVAFGNKTYAKSFASTPVSASPISPLPLAPITFGWLDNSTDVRDHYDFDGTLDEVAIYRRALPATEIQQHYQDGLEGKGYPLLPEWRVDLPLITR